jgi:hypothetical protein
MPEDVHAEKKKNHVQNARDQNPFPYAVPLNKAVSFKKRLNGYYDFLEQPAVCLRVNRSFRFFIIFNWSNLINIPLFCCHA